MAEQQLIEYIKKARAAGQTDEQTRTLLRQNGWTDSEINEAFLAAIKSQQEPARPAEPRAQFPPEHQVSGQPLINTRQDLAQKPASTASADYKLGQSQPLEQFSPADTAKHFHANNMSRSTAVGRLILKISVVVILLAIVGAGLYFVLMQGDLVQDVINKAISYFSPKADIVQPTDESSGIGNEVDESSNVSTTIISGLATRGLVTVSEEYDADKIALIAFGQSGDKVVYCAPPKNNADKISCFLNDQKFLDNPYILKPYWVGISPDGQRIAFLYYNSAEKQSFVFENGAEGQRYNGIITSPKFSRDSRSLLYVVMENSGKDFVVLGGKTFLPHDKIFTAPDWSADGRYILYGARDGGEILWIADEVQSLETQQPGT